MAPKSLEVRKEDPDLKLLKKAARAIESGKLVIYPTDTVYGLAADATNDDAVGKVFEAKSRPLDKPISVAVNSLSMAYYVGKLTYKAEKLVQTFLPGPLTIIVEKRPSVSDLLSAGSGKIGIRIPDHPVTLKLIEIVGRPITTTSANVSGSGSPESFEDALDQVGSRVEYAIDSGDTDLREPSTVVDLTGKTPDVLREGPISRSELKSILD